MSATKETPPTLTLPAALLWLRQHGRVGDALDAAREGSRRRPGVAWLRPDLAALLPTAGDPALFDAAAAMAGELLASDRRRGRGLPALAAVIVPGRVRVAGEEMEVPDDPLIADLTRRPPAVEPGSIHLSTYAAARLEVPRRLSEPVLYDGPSGTRIPLLRLLGEESYPHPWRNPHLLRRRLPYTPRPELGAALARMPRAVRVEGLLGSGKSRGVHNALVAEGIAPLWLNARPARHGGPALAAQLLARLMERYSGVPGAPGAGDLGLADGTELSPERLLAPGDAPPEIGDPEAISRLLPSWLAAMARSAGESALVCDNLEAASEEDRGFLAILRRGAEERRLRLVLIARSGAAWSPELADLPAVTVPQLPPSEMTALARHLFAGLSLPTAVEERILAASGGVPFVAEEALTGMIHRRLIRQTYGNFFFTGDDGVAFAPSDRLIQHAEADARRLGEVEVLRLAALADAPLPASAPEVAADAAGIPADPGWSQPYLGAGWLGDAESPWDDGVELAVTGFARALDAALGPEERARLRRHLGMALPATAGSAWSRYRLLAGSPEALDALDAAVRETADGEDVGVQRRLAEALHAELEAHRGRRGDPASELEILWQLLPLARRLGTLHDFAAEVDRGLALAAGDGKRELALTGLKAEIAEEQGDLGAAEEAIREALKRWGLGGETGGAVLVLHLSRLLVRQDRQAEARELLEQVEPILKKGGSPALHASCLFYLGNAALHQRRFEDALALHQQALATRRRMGKPRLVGTSLSALGRLTLLMGRYADALQYYREAGVVLRECRDQLEEAFALLGIGRVLSRLGDYSGASSPLRQALTLREKGDDVVGQAIARLAVAENHLHLENPITALQEARRAHFSLTMVPKGPALGDAEHLLGRILLLQRQAGKAARHFAAAAEIHRHHGIEELVAFDAARGVEAAILADEPGEVRRLLRRLEELVESCRHAEQREILDYYLARGVGWIEAPEGSSQSSIAYLRRAYRGLLRKADLLPRDLRHRFLYQVTEHQAIIRLATETGLSWPDLPVFGAPLGDGPSPARS